jgi:nucleoside-diphosphate-sugar epimerase
MEAAHGMALYLVTGGAGFIGSHMVEALRRRGERVRVADSLITGHRANLAHLDEVEFLEGDLADPAFARQVVEGVTYVLHQAAIPSVPRSVDDPITTNRANIDATLSVLVAARDAGVRRVVYAGSSSAYGNLPEQPKREDMPVAPLTPYALQKLVGEQYMQMFTDLYGLSTVTIRYFNVFGPRQDPSSAYSGVISLFIRYLVEGKVPTIHGDGEQTRDFAYVANVVDGAIRALHATTDVSGKVINVSTGVRISLNDLFRALKTITGADVEPLHGPARAGDVRDSLADITRARELLDYAPIVSLEDGLRRTVEWYASTQVRS